MREHQSRVRLYLIRRPLSLPSSNHFVNKMKAYCSLNEKNAQVHSRPMCNTIKIFRRKIANFQSTANIFHKNIIHFVLEQQLFIPVCINISGCTYMCSVVKLISVLTPVRTFPCQGVLTDLSAFTCLHTLEHCLSFKQTHFIECVCVW